MTVSKTRIIHLSNNIINRMGSFNSNTGNHETSRQAWCQLNKELDTHEKKIDRLRLALIKHDNMFFNGYIDLLREHELLDKTRPANQMATEKLMDMGVYEEAGVPVFKKSTRSLRWIRRIILSKE